MDEVWVRLIYLVVGIGLGWTSATARQGMLYAREARDAANRALSNPHEEPDHDQA